MSTSSGMLPDSSRSEEHTSELQSRFGISYAVFCLKKKKFSGRVFQSLYPSHDRSVLARVAKAQLRRSPRAGREAAKRSPLVFLVASGSAGFYTLTPPRPLRL